MWISIESPGDNVGSWNRGGLAGGGEVEQKDSAERSGSGVESEKRTSRTLVVDGKTSMAQLRPPMLSQGDADRTAEC